MEAQDLIDEYNYNLPWANIAGHIRRTIASKPIDLDTSDIKRAIMLMGPGDTNIDFDSDEDWSDDMIQEYADHLYNYLYNYTDDVHKVNPNIDTKEEHRGPMAQDIEQVAPDCIKETNGVKTVDGDRLALINAGVIGDLSRRLIALEKEVKSLKEELYGNN